jgi:hypothetical protein
MPTERVTFQKLAQLRVDEAKALLGHRQSSGAYYLAGYAIECALKAVIAKQFRAEEIPDRALVNQNLRTRPFKIVEPRRLGSRIECCEARRFRAGPQMVDRQELDGTGSLQYLD